MKFDLPFIDGVSVSIFEDTPDGKSQTGLSYDDGTSDFIETDRPDVPKVVAVTASVAAGAALVGVAVASAPVSAPLAAMGGAAAAAGGMTLLPNNKGSKDKMHTVSKPTDTASVEELNVVMLKKQLERYRKTLEFFQTNPSQNADNIQAIKTSIAIVEAKLALS